MRVTDVPEIAHLSIPEKILFAEDLWESIAAKDSEIPVPDHHKHELDRRYKAYMKNPGKLLPLHELQAKIATRK